MKSLIDIGFSRWNEATFQISSEMLDLSLEDMNRLRAIIPVAIGVAEDMFRRAIESRNQTSTANP